MQVKVISASVQNNAVTLITTRQKQKSQGERRIQQVNAALLRKHSILKKLSPLGKTTISRQYLELTGFDFHYLTQLYRTQKGTLITCAMTTDICFCPKKRYSSTIDSPIWTRVINGSGRSGGLLYQIKYCSH